MATMMQYQTCVLCYSCASGPHLIHYKKCNQSERRTSLAGFLGLVLKHTNKSTIVPLLAMSSQYTSDTVGYSIQGAPIMISIPSLMLVGWVMWALRLIITPDDIYKAIYQIQVFIDVSSCILMFQVAIQLSNPTNACTPHLGPWSFHMLKLQQSTSISNVNALPTQLSNDTDDGWFNSRGRVQWCDDNKVKDQYLDPSGKVCRPASVAVNLGRTWDNIHYLNSKLPADVVNLLLYDHSFAVSALISGNQIPVVKLSRCRASHHCKMTSTTSSWRFVKLWSASSIRWRECVPGDLLLSARA